MLPQGLDHTSFTPMGELMAVTINREKKSLHVYTVQYILGYVHHYKAGLFLTCCAFIVIMTESVKMMVILLCSYVILKIMYLCITYCL